jgi:hypothetical protein
MDKQLSLMNHPPGDICLVLGPRKNLRSKIVKSHSKQFRPLER